MKPWSFVQYLNLFVYDACLAWNVCCCGVCSVNACMLIYCHCLSALDLYNTESTEEVFGYQGED
jgi:hypothetical protein